MQQENVPPQFSRWLIAIIFIVLLLITSYIFDGLLEDINNPNQQLSVSGNNEVILKQNRYGHYVVTGMIDNQQVTFLLDTGATVVSIPEHIAAKLGLEKGRRYMTETANGSSVSYRTNIAQLSVGDIVINNVEGSISSGMEFDEILLGMSFLKHLDMTQQGKTLILHVPR